MEHRQRMTNAQRMKKRIIRNMRNTWKTKLFAIGWIGLSIWASCYGDDGGPAVLALMFGVPMLFTNKSVF